MGSAWSQGSIASSIAPSHTVRCQPSRSKRNLNKIKYKTKNAALHLPRKPCIFTPHFLLWRPTSPKAQSTERQKKRPTKQESRPSAWVAIRFPAPTAVCSQSRLRFEPAASPPYLAYAMFSARCATQKSQWNNRHRS